MTASPLGSLASTVPSPSITEGGDARLERGPAWAWARKRQAVPSGRSVGNISVLEQEFRRKRETIGQKE